jgi:uracil-DNA glycosylase
LRKIETWRGSPDEGVYWDTETLGYRPGVPLSEAPDSDQMGGVVPCYARIFNPARVHQRAMKADMAMRYHDTPPDARIIPAPAVEGCDENR